MKVGCELKVAIELIVYNLHRTYIHLVGLVNGY